MNKSSGGLTYLTGEWAGFGSFGSGGTFNYFSHDDTWKSNGTSLKDFYRKMRRGDLLPYTDYNQYRVTGSHVSGDALLWTTSNPSNGYTTNGTPSNVPALATNPEISKGELLSMVDSDYLERAGQMALERLGRGGFDFTTWLGELGETTRMLGTTLARLHGGLTNPKIFRNLKRLKKPQTWSNAWLEWRYGWRPLLYDMQDIRDALTKTLEDVRIFNERAGFSVTINGTADHSYEVSSSIQHYTRDFTAVVGYRGLAASKLSPARVHIDPLPTAWELTKFSFIVDWFWDVGLSLSALSVLLRTPDLVAAQSFLVEYEMHMYQTGWDNKSGWAGTYSYDSRQTGILKQRTAGIPSFVPSFNPRLDDSKIFDILSIFGRPYGQKLKNLRHA